MSTEPTVVRGEPERIQRAVSNLVDNALKWSPPRRRAWRSTSPSGELSVRDHGPGFRRPTSRTCSTASTAPTTRAALPGSGLGLAIVRQAAEAHGGDVEAANAPDGGALVRVSFGTDAQGTG